MLVPSKQGNLENTKGAANKHNLIPPVLLHLARNITAPRRGRLSVFVRLWVCASTRAIQCQSLVDLSRRVAACAYSRVCVCVCVRVYVLCYMRTRANVRCEHSSSCGEKCASAAGERQVCVPSHPGVCVCDATATPKCPPWIPGTETGLYCTQRCTKTRLAAPGALAHGCESRQPNSRHPALLF